jgi:hypothetical protein
MKMLMLVYSGASPNRVASLLDAHHAGGWTEFAGVHVVVLPTETFF